ncbi:major facilitator superfamily domain-containing protein [Hypoxylon argillaceum]|nr:major facilitator superfamily domain-containing protein [Hypoxylon argillaceum]
MAARSGSVECPGDDEITERTPFIRRASPTTGSHTIKPGDRERASSIASVGSAAPKARGSGGIVAILCIVIFVASAAGGFQNMSMTRIFEDILCRQYYDQLRSNDEPISEDMCKVDAIQSKLAYLFAIQLALNAGVSVLVALPWGIAADKIGRRPVFALGLGGMSTALLFVMVVGWFPQTFPPQLIWLSPLFYLIGGADPVVSATITSMAIDVVPESQRSAVFMRMHGSSMVGNLISPALASIMMSSTGPWPPILLAFLLTSLPAFMIFLVPESLKHKKTDDNEPSSSTLKARVTEGLGELKKSAKIFSSSSMMIVLLITMLQLSLILCTHQFLAQFASKRYHIPIAKTGYIQSIYGVVFITVAFFIMPFVSSQILKPSTPAFLRFDDDRRRDLFLARASYIASMVGTFILGVSGSIPGFVFGLVILTFGVSSEGFLKSIATLYVSAEQRSRLYTMLSLSAIASNLWVSPALAALFSLGMRLGGAWIGLPYFGISGICVVMFCMALFLKPPPNPKVDEEADSDRGSDSE